MYMVQSSEGDSLWPTNHLNHVNGCLCPMFLCSKNIFRLPRRVCVQGPEVRQRTAMAGRL